MGFRQRALGASLTVIVILAGTAIALAAQPQKGATFKGTLNKQFIPVGVTNPHSGIPQPLPVSFAVSRSGRDVLEFRYEDDACAGTGTDTQTVGTIKISAAGVFKVTNVKSSSPTTGATGTNYSSVSGKFTSARKASGTISLTQRYTAFNGKHVSCRGSVTFSAQASQGRGRSRRATSFARS